MSKAIYLSIKSKYTKLIESGEKNYEFRKYIPRQDFDKIFVYETVPSRCLKYILTIDSIAKYPQKIDIDGYGNIEFNNGLKKSTYAYHISKVEKIKNPIPLKVLKEEFSFTPPQSFAYEDKYKELSKYINNMEKSTIVTTK